MKQSFSKSKKFGDKLEKDIAIRVIKRLHPDCKIESPDNIGKFRENGNAIPDHIVTKNGKPIVLYDSKNKSRLYGYHGHTEKFWSADEKLLQYRKFADTHGVPCFLIYYSKEDDKDNVYIVDVNVEPKFYKEIKNEYGRDWYGYYLSQTKAYPVISKHTENIRDKDAQEVYGAPTVELKKKTILKILDRCRPDQSLRPMAPKKLKYWERQIPKLKTKFQLDDAITNMLFAGEGMSMGNKNYKNRINYA